jgi:hypothetical protein
VVNMMRKRCSSGKQSQMRVFPFLRWTFIELYQFICIWIIKSLMELWYFCAHLILLCLVWYFYA